MFEHSTELHDLSRRPAGYSVVLECLAQQQLAVPRSKLKRILGFRPLHPDAWPWFAGALGEMHVGRILAKLGPEWLVLHAVPVGDKDTDIDHVVIGPAGAFTINTKHHRGVKVWVSPKVLMVAGQKMDHLRNSRSEAKSASKRLLAALGVNVPVHPLIVVVGASDLTIKERPDDVTVVTDAQLLRWLRRQKPAVDEATLAQLRQVASTARFWHDTADATVDPAHLVTFAALQAEDIQARRRRVGWMLLVLAGAAVALALAGPSLIAALIQVFTGALT
ncbi:nuclease-related domain-containing protein [Homoserinimonas sp. A447]